MRPYPLRECGYAIVFILGLFLLYGGAYLAIVVRNDWGFIDGKQTSILEYRFGGDWSNTFFAPAHAVDKQIRRDMWSNEVDPTALYGYLMHGTTNAGRPLP
jgi:hypothetical protein